MHPNYPLIFWPGIISVIIGLGWMFYKIWEENEKRLRKPSAPTRQERLISIGNYMSNALYNLSQDTSVLDQTQRDRLRKLAQEWDDARYGTITRSYRVDKKGP